MNKNEILNKFYDSYTILNDIFNHRNHIYVLLGRKGEIDYLLATYSLKTKKIMIKDACGHIPSKSVLEELVRYAEEKSECED